MSELDERELNDEELTVAMAYGGNGFDISVAPQTTVTPQTTVNAQTDVAAQLNTAVQAILFNQGNVTSTISQTNGNSTWQTMISKHIP